MLWNLPRASSLPPADELMRRAHSQWLTAAMRAGNRCPRIPIRPVSRGGFADLTCRPEGRRWAQAWWEAAFGRVGAEED